MLEQGHESKMYYLRRADMHLSHIPQSEILNFDAYSSAICSLLMACDSCALKKPTKYIAKKSFDQYVLRHPTATPEQMEFWSVSFFRFAVKFNEDPSIYDQFTFDQCVELCEGRYSKDEFEAFELQIWNDPQCRLDMTTAYDFLGVYQTTFFMSITQKEMKELTVVTDFALSIPEFTRTSAECLFYGALIFAHELLGKDSKYALNQCYYQNEAFNASQVIKKYYLKEIAQE